MNINVDCVYMEKVIHVHVHVLCVCVANYVHSFERSSYDLWRNYKSYVLTRDI